MMLRVILTFVALTLQAHSAFNFRASKSCATTRKSALRASDAFNDFIDDPESHTVEEDNIYQQWTLQDDKTLYELFKSGGSLDDMCKILKRGQNGVKARIRNINNKNHKAFIRLFGGDPTLITDPQSGLRPCREVINRLLWDPYLDLTEFTFGYKDRFNGILEAAANAPNENVKGKERLLILAIPEHKVEYIRYKNRIVWSKSDRIDLVFGSKGNCKIDEIIASYDEWQSNEELERAKSLSLSDVKIYCDLDGVLADFDWGVNRIFKRKPDEVSPKQLWSRLACTPEFFSSLPWLEDGRSLWKSISHMNPTILTGCPRGNWAQPQKVEWCRRELGPDVRVVTCSSKDKALYCESNGSILIDDRVKAKDPWVAAGGVFIHHRSALETIRELERLGYVNTSSFLTDAINI